MKDAIESHQFLLANPIIWAIILVALFCYGVLIELCMETKDQSWYVKTLYWTESLQTMLASLPLLGLLGTIAGLLETFLDISIHAGLNLQELVTGGIGEAMFTTQLGLLMVIPGMIILTYLNHAKNRWHAVYYHEIEYRK